MLTWMKKPVPTARDQAEAEQGRTARWQGSILSGKYQALYKYLENRYANTVVLTFAEIEDLLGFTLPDLARLQQSWWTDKDAGPARDAHSQSWTLAGRTATPNLMAQTVVFERACA